jgi:hypothetical protein
MNNINLALKNIESRNNNLSQDLKDLKSELQVCFEKNLLQAGVINPGYFSYFLPILESYRTLGIITKYHLSEEQYTNGYSGNIVKIPVVDVFTTIDNFTTTRIFITSELIINSQNR